MRINDVRGALTLPSRWFRFHKYLVANVLLVILSIGFAAKLSASTSEEKNGVRYFDIVMAYEGKVDESKDDNEEPSKIKFQKVLKHFAYGIYQCSQGKHKLRKVRIFSKVKSEDGTETDNYTPKSNACDINWVINRMHPHASTDADPMTGVSQGQFIETCDNPTSNNYNLSGAGRTDNYETRAAGAALTHEWGHYHYGVRDEYIGVTSYGTEFKGGDDGTGYWTWNAGVGTCHKLPSINTFLLNDGTPIFCPMEEQYRLQIRSNALYYMTCSALMINQGGYAYDWRLDGATGLWDDANGLWNVETGLWDDANGLWLDSKAWNCKRATTEVPATDESAQFLCFSKRRKVIFSQSPVPAHGYVQIVALDTKQYSANKNLSSWSYVSKGGYANSKDFQNPIDRLNLGDNTVFTTMSFANAISDLDIIWNPADFVALVIDNSGSMQGDRIANAKIAANELIKVMPDGTKVAVYTFSTSTSTVVAPQTLNGTTRASIKSAIDGIYASGGTYIGRATGVVLGDVASQLADVSIDGAKVYLLSDGDSSDSALQYAANYSEKEIPIYTFGYGSSASGDLSILASRTGAKYYYAPSGAAIRRVFQEAAAASGGRGQGASGTIRSGGGSGSGYSGGSGSGSSTESFSKTFFVDSTMPDLRLTVTYNVNTPALSVFAPDGSEVAASYIETVGNEKTATFEVANPQIGAWRISGTKLAGYDISYYYDSSAVVEGYRLTARAERVSAAEVRPRTYRVEAKLRRSAAVNGANLTGSLQQDGVEIDVFAFDCVADGLYEAYLTVDGDPKTLSLNVAANNPSGKAVETFKGINYEGAEPPEDKVITEKFRRTVSVTFPDDTGEVIYVDSSRPDDSGSGSAWATAKKTLQAAINAVATNGTILVTNGTYAAISTRNKPLTIKSVEGWEKTTIDGKGAMRCADLGDGVYDHASVLVGFRLINGEAGASGGGGVRGGKLIRCRIEYCHAAFGGGAYNSILDDCIVAFNSADASGGGAKDCTICGTTVAENKTDADSGSGGGISGSGAVNSIIWGNENGVGGADNCAGSGVHNCCTIPAHAGEGNISSDPRFVDAANGDFALKGDSPCLNAGNAGFANEPTDGMGHPREMGGGVDMGACEYLALPVAPKGVSASDGLSSKSVSVVWNRSMDADSYNVLRYNPDATEATLLASGVKETCFVDESAASGVKYRYCVSAVNVAGVGPNSVEDVGWVSTVEISDDGVTADLVFFTPGGQYLQAPLIVTSDPYGMVSEKEFEPGETIYLNYAFYNAGDGSDVSDFVNRFTLSNGYYIDDSWQGHTLPEHSWGRLEWGHASALLQDLAPGEYTLTCTLNVNGNLPEADTANNTTSITFKVKGPNLTIPSASVSKEVITLSETAVLHWRVENKGETTAKKTNTKIALYDYDNSSGRITWKKDIAYLDSLPLAAGGGREFTKALTGKSLGVGEYNLLIYTDGKYTLSESDETDNYKLVYLKVVNDIVTRSSANIDWQFKKLKSAEPDSFFLSASSSLKKKATTFKVGQRIYMRRAFWNAKKNAVNGLVTSSYWLNGIYHETSTDTSYIDAKSILYNKITSPDFLQNLPAGKYTLTAVLDSNDKWWETNEKNNIRRISFTVVGAPTIYGEVVYTCALNESVNWPVSSEGSMTVKGLPKGMKYSGGVISGKASKTGTYTVNFTSKNAAGTRTKTIKIVVVNPGFDVSVNVRANGATDAVSVAAGETVPMFVGVVQNISVASTPGKNGIAKSGASSVTATGLPPGLKYSKGVISGVPSKVGTYTVKLTFKNALGWTKTFTMKMQVKALPVFARGTFNGWSYDADYYYKRKVTVSVTTAGKITAKVGTLSFSRTGWTVDDAGRYCANLLTTRTVGTGKKAKKYTDVLTLTLDPEKGWTEDQLSGAVATFNGTVKLADALVVLNGGESALVPLDDDIYVSARRNPFGDNVEAKAFAAELAALGTQGLTDGEGLVWNIKVASNGVATIARATGTGKNKKTVSATAVVAWNGDDYGPYAVFLVDGKILEVSWSFVPSTPLWQNTNGEGH